MDRSITVPDQTDLRQAVPWPTTSWDPFLVATELVIDHRLRRKVTFMLVLASVCSIGRVMEWYANWLGLDDVQGPYHPTVSMLMPLP